MDFFWIFCSAINTYENIKLKNKQMKKVVYFVIIGFLFTLFACKPGGDSYVFSRPTHPQNFKTLLDGELYTYTTDEVPSARADYYLKVLGTVVTYGDSLSRYGHCWGTSPNPTDIETETLRTVFENTTIGRFDSTTFESVLTDLEPGTKYYIRTYVIKINLEDGSQTVAFNPVVSEIDTKPAIDEWFEQFVEQKPIPDVRFDALVFNFGDTIFFGTGDKGLGVELNKDIIMYDPSTGLWDPDFIGGLPTNNGLPGELMNGIGFAVAYQKTNAPEGQITRSIFVGIGDHGGRDLQSEKSNRLIEIDLETTFRKETSYVFPGRSDAVCFVVNNKAYIGTGVGTNPYYDWYVFDPVAETDGNVQTPGWRSMANSNPPQILRKGAVAFEANGRGYFGLGTDGSGVFYNDFWSFRPTDPTDLTKGIWTRLEDFPGEARANAVAFAIGDQGYVGTGDNIVGNMEVEDGYTGDAFNDFYRYNPFTDTWHAVKDYTADKTNRDGAIRPITRAIGFAIPSKKLGYVGYGLEPVNYPVPNPPVSTSSFNAQKDFWKYQPFNDDAK